MTPLKQCLIWMVIALVFQACAVQKQLEMNPHNVFEFRVSNLDSQSLTAVHGFINGEDSHALILKKQLSENIAVTFSLNKETRRPIIEEVQITTKVYSRKSLDSLMLKYHFANLTAVCLTEGYVEEFPNGVKAVEEPYYSFAARHGLTGYHFLVSYRRGFNSEGELSCVYYFPEYFN